MGMNVLIWVGVGLWLLVFQFMFAVFVGMTIAGRHSEASVWKTRSFYWMVVAIILGVVFLTGCGGRNSDVRPLAHKEPPLVLEDFEGYRYDVVEYKCWVGDSVAFEGTVIDVLTHWEDYVERDGLYYPLTTSFDNCVGWVRSKHGPNEIWH